MKKDKDQFINLNHARKPEQIEVMKKIEKDKVCPFCLENLKNYHKRPIIKEGLFWIATDSQWPYEGAKEHILFINKKHITDMRELDVEAWTDLLGLVQSLSTERKMAGGTFVMRFGDTRATGATVNHLHAQLISGDPEKPDRKPVLARVG